VIWNELTDTLTALACHVTPAGGDGLLVTEAELLIPLEVRTAVRGGRLVILAQPPHTRWKSGFLPSTHVARMRIGLETGDAR
jgi:hypothetical protein